MGQHETQEMNLCHNCQLNRHDPNCASILEDNIYIYMYMSFPILPTVPYISLNERIGIPLKRLEQKG